MIWGEGSDRGRSERFSRNRRIEAGAKVVAIGTSE
jgi:hypothetical protein